MTNPARFAITVVAVTALLAGCSTPPVSEVTQPIELTFAHIDNDLELDPAAQWFMDRVAELSDGQLTLSFANECCGREPDAQTLLVGGVADGEWDLGWVATRGLEDAGISSLQALSAPGIIRSYTAQAAVLSSAPGAMLDGVDAAGVTAIALEPGTLRRPIAVGTALLGPDTWVGVPFWSYSSSLSAAAVAATGALSTQVGNDERNSGLDNGEILGAENSIVWQAFTQHVPHAVITANAALWPRTSVLIGNPDALSRLTGEQLAWITQAADETSLRTMDVAQLDLDAIPTFCATGGRFAIASDEQLVALDAVFSSVVDTLPFIDDIRAAAAGLQDDEEIPAACLI